MTAAILSRRGPPQGSLRDEAKLVESHVPSLRMTAIRALTARCLRHAHCAERYAARGKVVRWRDTESSLDLGHSVMRSVLTPCQRINVSTYRVSWVEILREREPCRTAVLVVLT